MQLFVDYLLCIKTGQMGHNASAVITAKESTAMSSSDKKLAKRKREGVLPQLSNYDWVSYVSWIIWVVLCEKMYSVYIPWCLNHFHFNLYEHAKILLKESLFLRDWGTHHVHITYYIFVGKTAGSSSRLSVYVTDTESWWRIKWKYLMLLTSSESTQWIRRFSARPWKIITLTQQDR